MTMIDDGPVTQAATGAAPGADDLATFETPRSDAPTPNLSPDTRPALSHLLRPAAASALVSLGAGFEIGGIFGSWFARGLGAVAAVLGAAAAVTAQRSTRRSRSSRSCMMSWWKSWAGIRPG